MTPLVPDQELIDQVESFTTEENAHEVNQVLFMYMACAEVSEDAVREEKPRLYRRVQLKFDSLSLTLKHFVAQKGVGGPRQRV
jgi:hypothetical protein